MKFGTHIYSEQLEKECSYINEFARRIIPYYYLDDIFNEVNNEVEVIFDDNSKPHVRNTFDSFLGLIDELFNMYKDSNNEAILNLLRRLSRIGMNNICPEDIYYALYENEIIDDDEYYDVLRKLCREFENIHMGYDVSGLYNHDYKRIVLFTRNIKDSFEEYLSVFTHEYFHAIHHYILDKTNRESLNRYYHNVILESLARYFQIEYLESVGCKIANDLKDSINRYSPIFYPYSGAKYFYDSYWGKIDFSNVFHLSTLNFRNSLKELIRDRYEYEIILKMKNYKIVGIQKRSSILGIDNSIGSNFYDNDDIYGNNNSSNCSIKIYKVKQSKSWANEAPNGYIFGGEHYKMINNIKKGDIILHEYQRQIVALSIAKTDGYHSMGEFGNSSGYYARCLYDILCNSWDIDYGPQQVYIQLLDINRARHIINEISNINDFDAILHLIKKILF